MNTSLLGTYDQTIAHGEHEIEEAKDQIKTLESKIDELRHHIGVQTASIFEASRERARQIISEHKVDPEKVVIVDICDPKKPHTFQDGWYFSRDDRYVYNVVDGVASSMFHYAHIPSDFWEKIPSRFR